MSRQEIEAALKAITDALSPAVPAIPKSIGLREAASLLLGKLPSTSRPQINLEWNLKDYSDKPVAPIWRIWDGEHWFTHASLEGAVVLALAFQAEPKRGYEEAIAIAEAKIANAAEAEVAF